MNWPENYLEDCKRLKKHDNHIHQPNQIAFKKAGEVIQELQKIDLSIPKLSKSEAGGITLSWIFENKNIIYARIECSNDGYVEFYLRAKESQNNDISLEEIETIERLLDERTRVFHRQPQKYYEIEEEILKLAKEKPDVVTAFCTLKEKDGREIDEIHQIGLFQILAEENGLSFERLRIICLNNRSFENILFYDLVDEDYEEKVLQAKSALCYGNIISHSRQQQPNRNHKKL